MSLAARLVKAIGALAVTASISAGVPWALFTWIGSPIPKHVPTLASVQGWMSMRLDIHLFIVIAVYLLWACWAVFVAQVLVQVPGVAVDLVHVLRHHELRQRSRAVGPGGALARGLIAAFTIALLAPRGINVQAVAKASTGFVVGSSTRSAAIAPAVPGARSQAAADTARNYVYAKAASPEGTPSVATAESARVPPAPDSRATVTDAPVDIHIVTDGDTLWDIAGHHFGDAERWRDIFRLNAGRQQPDGHMLSDPDLILPGWQLRLPAAGTPQTASALKATITTPATTVESTGSVPQATTQPTTITIPEAEPDAPPVPHPIAVPGTSTAPTAVHSAQPPHEPPAARIVPRDRTAIHLPGGGLVPITLASGVAAALALARLRTRAKARIWFTDDSRDAELSASPASPVAAALQRAHQATVCGPGIGLFQDEEDFGDDPYTDPEAPNSTTPTPAEGPEPPWTLTTEPCDTARPSVFAPTLRALLESAEAPDDIHIAVRDNIPIPLGAATGRGLGLTGNGAADTARSLLACALAAGGPRALDQAAEIHTTADILTTLLGAGYAVPETSRLTIHTDLSALLDDAETERAARAAEIGEYGHTNAANVRRFENIRPFQPRILLAAPEPQRRHRLDALAAVASDTDMHLVLLGPWDAGCAADIASDHTVAATGVGAALLDGAAAYGISIEETTQILAALNSAWTSPGGDEPFTDTAELDGALVALPGTDEPDDIAAEQSRPRLAVLPTAHRVSAAPGVLVLNLMGPFAAEVDATDVTGCFQPAHRTLLLYLALRDRPVLRSEITDTLWVEEDFGDEKAKAKRKTRFDSRLYQTKKAMTKAAGREADFITSGRSTGLIALNRGEVLTDLVLFDQLTDAATKAGTDEEKVAHLEAACGLYRGPLDESIRGDWLLEHREDRLRRYRDVAGDLARVVSRTDADRGLAILNTLLEHDLFNEDLYRRIMRGQAKLGRLDAVRRTFNLLETRFEAIDMEVDPSTAVLAQALTRRSAA